MALSYGVTDYIEGGVITAVMALNVAIGFYQEFDAEKEAGFATITVVALRNSCPRR
jgi:magnesium-transporting ATPase (P-type)